MKPLFLLLSMLAGFQLMLQALVINADFWNIKEKSMAVLLFWSQTAFFTCSLLGCTCYSFWRLARLDTYVINDNFNEIFIYGIGVNIVAQVLSIVTSVVGNHFMSTRWPPRYLYPLPDRSKSPPGTNLKDIL